MWDSLERFLDKLRSMEEQADLFKNPSPVVPNSPERKSVVLSLSSNTNEEVQEPQEVQAPKLKKLEFQMDEYTNDCYEVRNVHKSFSKLRISFNQALKAFKSGNSAEALLKYSLALNLYISVNNFSAAGIICNNMGNIYLQMNSIDIAIQKYKEAVEMWDKSGSGDISSRITRKMNLALAYREKFYEQINDADFYFSKGNKSVEERDTIKINLTKFEDVCSELCRHFKEHDQPDMVHCIKYSLLLTLIYSEMGSKRRSDCRLQDSQNFFDNFKEEKPIWIKKKRFEEYERNKVFLTQELQLVLAHIEIKEGNYRSAAQFLRKLLCLGVNYSYSIRKRAFMLLDIIYKLNKTTMPLSLRRIVDNMLKNNQNGQPRNFLLILDYSKSMSQGGKIENSIKSILKIWDEHIKPDDNVCFIKFNLNVYTDFNLGAKKINTTSKRYQIEQSTNPYERTSLFDAISTGLNQLERENRKYSQLETFFVIYSDGKDTSSVSNQKNIMKRLKNYMNIRIICVGLAVDEETEDMLTTISKCSNGGIYISSEDTSFNMLYQAIKNYSSLTKIEETYEEFL